MSAKHSPAASLHKRLPDRPSGRAVGGRLVGMDPLEIGDRFSGNTTPRLVQGVARADLGQPQFRLCCREIFLAKRSQCAATMCDHFCASAKSSYSSLDMLASCAYTCLLYGGRAQRMDWARFDGSRAPAYRARGRSPSIGDKTCRGPPGRSC